jgi:hypothetical protein
LDRDFHCRRDGSGYLSVAFERALREHSATFRNRKHA